MCAINGSKNVIKYAFGLFCKSNLRATNVSNMITLLNNKPSEESLMCLLGRRYKSYLGVCLILKKEPKYKSYLGVGIRHIHMSSTV